MNQDGLMVTQGNGIPASQEITEDLFARFIRYADVTASSQATYTRALRRLGAFLSSKGIRQPRREDLVDFRKELRDTGHKPATIQAYLAAARIFFKWTAQEGLYPNIGEHLKPEKLDAGHKRDYFTGDQLRRILAGIDRDSLRGLRDYAVTLLMMTTGARTIEISRADVGDLRTVGEYPVLYVWGKDRKEKSDYVKLSAPTEDAIRQYLKARGTVTEDGPLFISLSNNNRGGRLTTRAISGMIKDRLRAAGYDSPRQTAHSLRHSSITIPIQEGKSLLEVQQFARHKNPQTTMLYFHEQELTANTCGDAITSVLFPDLP